MKKILSKILVCSALALGALNMAKAEQHQVIKEVSADGMDPLDNQFTVDEEDWVLVSKTGWENNGFKKDPNWERLQMTFALNGSVSLGKTYTLPNDDNIQLVVDFEAQDAANHMTFVMVVDDEEFMIYDAATQFGRNTIIIKLPEVDALNGVDYAGKEVTIKLTVSQAEGTAGDAFMWGFTTESYTPAPVINYDPLDNQFKTGVEDWVLVGKTGWANNGFIKDPNWERLQMTYALNGSVTLGKTYTLPNDKNIKLTVDFESLDAANHMTFAMVVDDEEKVIYDAATQTGRNTITIKLPEVDALNGVSYAGKEVTIKLTVSQAEGTAGDAYMWGFKTECYPSNISLGVQKGTYYTESDVTDNITISKIKTEGAQLQVMYSSPLITNITSASFDFSQLYANGSKFVSQGEPINAGTSNLYLRKDDATNLDHITGTAIVILNELYVLKIVFSDGYDEENGYTFTHTFEQRVAHTAVKFIARLGDIADLADYTAIKFNVTVGAVNKEYEFEYVFTTLDAQLGTDASAGETAGVYYQAIIFKGVPADAVFTVSAQALGTSPLATSSYTYTVSTGVLA